MRIHFLQLFFVALIFSFSQLSAHGQKFHYSKPWKATVFFGETQGSNKIKGTLYTASDTSLTIRLKGQLREILYRDVDKIRLVKDHGKEGRRIIGGLVGAAAGAAITASVLTKNRAGEGRVYAGILGGIAGGIAGGGIGFAAAPGVYNFLFHKKMKVKHDPVSYQLLKSRLNRYVLKEE